MCAARDMDEVEMEVEDVRDPTIDSGGWGNVRVAEHAFDVLCVDLDNEVAIAEEPLLEFLQGSINPVDFEFRLRKAGLAVVEGYRAETIVIAYPGVFSIALREDIAYCDIRGVDTEDDGGRRVVVEGAKCGAREGRCLEVVVGSLLLGSPLDREGNIFPCKADKMMCASCEVANELPEKVECS